MLLRISTTITLIISVYLCLSIFLSLWIYLSLYISNCVLSSFPSARCRQQLNLLLCHVSYLSNRVNFLSLSTFCDDRSSVSSFTVSWIWQCIAVANSDSALFCVNLPECQSSLNSVLACTTACLIALVTVILLHSRYCLFILQSANSPHPTHGQIFRLPVVSTLPPIGPT